MNKPATIYEKRVISKTIKKEGNNMHINTTNNTTTKTQIQTQIQTKTETQTQTQTKIIKTENYTNDVDNNNELNANQKEIDEDSPDVQIINIEITKKEKKTEKDNKQDKEGKKVAIKSVWKSDIEKNECFKKEIDISLDVQHDSIVKCIDVYEDLKNHLYGITLYKF